MIVQIGSLAIEMRTKNHMSWCIGSTTDFKPVLCFQPEDIAQARIDLTNYYNRFNEVLETGIQFTEAEHEQFGRQFEERAYIKANEQIDAMLEQNNGFEQFGWYFTFLPDQKSKTYKK